MRAVSDKWRFGAALAAISGAEWDLVNNWTGRYKVQEVSLFTLALALSVAYWVNDWLSLGAQAAVI